MINAIYVQGQHILRCVFTSVGTTRGQKGVDVVVVAVLVGFGLLVAACKQQYHESAP